MATTRYQPGTRRASETVVIADHEFIVKLAERGCACHPTMPVVRTADGWACQGCGVHSA